MKPPKEGENDVSIQKSQVSTTQQSHGEEGFARRDRLLARCLWRGRCAFVPCAVVDAGFLAIRRSPFLAFLAFALTRFPDPLITSATRVNRPVPCLLAAA